MVLFHFVEFSEILRCFESRQCEWSVHFNRCNKFSVPVVNLHKSKIYLSERGRKEKRRKRKKEKERLHKVVMRLPSYSYRLPNIKSHLVPKSLSHHFYLIRFGTTDPLLSDAQIIIVNSLFRILSGPWWKTRVNSNRLYQTTHKLTNLS